MKTVISGLLTVITFFSIGFVTFPKSERVYKCVKWEPKDLHTIPINSLENNLSKFNQKIEIKKNDIERNLEIIEVIQDSIKKDTIYFVDSE